MTSAGIYSYFHTVHVSGHEEKFIVPEAYVDWNKAQEHSEFLWGDLLDELNCLIQQENYLQNSFKILKIEV
jgi:hypothetical protein